MAKMSFTESDLVESFLGMGGGYVLEFSDRTFRDCIGKTVGLDINDLKYSENGTSKARRLRKFIELEPDNLVGKLFKQFHETKLADDQRKGKKTNASEAERFWKLAERLSEGKIIEHIDAIQASNSDKDFHQLAKLIQESIEQNEPEAALDRLHTYLIKFLKELCDSHGVPYTKEETVNALYGKYFKGINSKGLIESEMSKKILQFSFQVMDAFNDVRNNKSFAHDNPVLNYDESVLIFRNVTATIKFIQSIETKHKNKAAEDADMTWKDLF